MKNRGKSFPIPAVGRSTGLNNEKWLDSIGSGSLPVDVNDLDKINSAADGKIRIEGLDTNDSKNYSQSANKASSMLQKKPKDPRMLALSEMTTPDAISD